MKKESKGIVTVLLILNIILAVVAVGIIIKGMFFSWICFGCILVSAISDTANHLLLGGGKVVKFFAILGFLLSIIILAKIM